MGTGTGEHFRRLLAYISIVFAATTMRNQLVCLPTSLIQVSASLQRGRTRGAEYVPNLDRLPFFRVPSVGKGGAFMPRAAVEGTGGSRREPKRSEERQKVDLVARITAVLPSKGGWKGKKRPEEIVGEFAPF